MALTELKGRPLGTQRVVIERGPVRVFAQALMDKDPTYTADGAPVPPTFPFVMPYWGSLGEGGAAEAATAGGGQASLLNSQPPELDATARRALEALQVDAAINLDDLLEKVENTSPSELIAALFELEMLGLVKQLPGKNFVKVW